MISLSKNILCEIFSYLKPTEICTVSRTCKRLNELCESDILWQASVDPGSGSQRKSIFCHRGRVTYNIFNKLKQTCILSGHVSTIKTIFIKRNKVLTCSDDESVRLWDIKKLRGNKIIQHTGSVACAQFWDKGIVSVSSDRTMKIYQKGKEIKSEYAHRSGINHLKEINGTKFITGGHDGAVKIWDLNEGKALITHQDFDRDISRVEVAQNYYCYTASLHNQIYLRNLDRPDILQEFE
jgi:WD40 repeat protein